MQSQEIYANVGAASHGHNAVMFCGYYRIFRSESQAKTAASAMANRPNGGVRRYVQGCNKCKGWHLVAGN